MKPFVILISCLLAGSGLFAQKQSIADLAFRHVEEKAAEWGLSREDIRELTVSDQYRTRHNGLTHVYLRQRYQGLPVFNTLAGIHIRPDGQVHFSNHRFEAKLADRINIRQPALSPGEALEKMASFTGGDLSDPPRVVQQSSEERLRFSGGSLSTHAITLQLEYLPLADGRLQLAWSGMIVEPRSSDAWLLHLDAQSGALLKKQNLTISCHFGHADDAFCPAEEMVFGHTAGSGRKAFTPAALPADGAQYRVFPVPVEAPSFGERSLVVDPADPLASPFGWHDTDGRPGNDFTITRGNNAHAYLDLIPDNIPDETIEADGGTGLIFDFPFVEEAGPDTYEEAMLTQLFYMNNVMHDFTYHYGFDEPAGNFQQANYGRGGRGTDAVRAEGQDGSSLNNANFFTPGDGDQPRMQMFLWTAAGNNQLELESPSLPPNTTTRYGSAAFGPLLRNEVSGEIAAVFSTDFDPSLGCKEIMNVNQINGKIALVTRGECAFEQKVQNAQNAGAIGVIVCNTDNNLLSMGGVDTIPDPTIPAVLIPNSACIELRQALEEGPVQATIKVPEFLDSGFDNGIIAHEYAHGISNRLTGGPAEPFCLFNDEQMGEGWSDFFALVTTVQPDANGRLPRGIGNYVLGAGPNGQGIRRQPYSTNFDVNNQTYDDIVGTRAPHPLGEIWAATLWDLYWALVDQYGWDPDLYTGSGGNNLAIQLVIDGMKLQACRPGFIDGRDAILAADAINNNGENECLIWEVFARRGLGWNARQGISENRNDNIQNFDVRPGCIRQLKIQKETTPVIAAGDTFTVRILVQNDQSIPATGVVVTDQIPEGAVYVAGSLEGGRDVRLEGNNLIIEIGDILAGQGNRLTYTLQSAPERISSALFTDDMESGIAGWRLRSISGPEQWRQTDRRAYSGERSWHIPNLEQRQDQSLQSLSPILLEGGHPVLRFFHTYEIEPGLDGGLVEVSTDGGFNWQPIPEAYFFRNAYTGRLASSSINNQNRNAFWGTTPDWVSTYIDLSAYVGNTVNFRFRFTANDGTQFVNPPVTEGWYVDDIQLFDMQQYQSVACVTSNEGNRACAEATAGGTIVDPSSMVTSTQEAALAADWSVFPNPAGDLVTVQVASATAPYQLQLMSLDGRTIKLWRGTDRRTTLSTAGLSPGLYVLRLETAAGSYTEKLIIE